MLHEHRNIYIWLQMGTGQLFKVVAHAEKGTVKLYNEYDHLLLNRTGLSKKQVELIEKRLMEQGATKLNGRTTSFVILKQTIMTE